MKFASYVTPEGRATYGLLLGDRLIDLGALHPVLPTLKDYIGSRAFALANAPMRSDGHDVSAITFLPVIPDPGKIICVGLNYGEHVRETGRELTESPALFVRMTESQVAHGQDIVRPPESQRLDYEGEIAVVIGKGGRRISEVDSWNHIAGYSCYNDGSIRDWQAATTQWTAGKNFFRTGGFGPWMVTADEIKPNQLMTLTTRLNGQVMQTATTAMMIHSIPRQIAYISTFIPLEAGDVIVTGTPGGVGNKRVPQVFMKPGDIVEIEVDAIGILRNGIRDEV